MGWQAEERGTTPAPALTAVEQSGNKHMATDHTFIVLRDPAERVNRPRE